MGSIAGPGLLTEGQMREGRRIYEEWMKANRADRLAKRAKAARRAREGKRRGE